MACWYGSPAPKFSEESAGGRSRSTGSSVLGAPTGRAVIPASAAGDAGLGGLRAQAPGGARDFAKAPHDRLEREFAPLVRGGGRHLRHMRLAIWKNNQPPSAMPAGQ